MANTFSNHSLEQIKTLHPDLQAICRYAIEYHDFRVQEGFRNEADQNKAFALGSSKLKFPQSKHNKTPSMAMDLIPFVNGKMVGWNDAKQWQYFGGLIIGISAILHKMGEIGHAVTWGHDWDGDNDLSDHKLVDSPHFQLEEPKQ